MSSYVPQTTLQGIGAPDLIYIPNNHSVYFTRPGLSTATQSYSRFYGYDPLTHLPQWDHEDELPPGTKLTGLANGIFAGWLANPRQEHGLCGYAQRLGPQASSTYVEYSSGPRCAYSQRAGGLSDITRSRHWETFTADKPELRNRTGLTGGHIRAGSNHFPSDSIHTASHHLPGQPPGPRHKDRSDVVQPHLPAHPSGEVTHRPLVAYSALMEGLNLYYSQGLKAKTGHRFDDVDDDVIIAYAKAHTSLFNRRVPDLFQTMTVGQQVNRGRHPSCLIPVPYLAQHYKYLDVILPLTPGYLRYLSNDVLRLLHVHLAAFDCGAHDNFLMRALVTDMAESRRNILSELENRGFTERLPHVVRLRGLTSSKSSSPESSSRLILRDRPPTLTAQQADMASQHGAAGKATAHNNTTSNDQSRGPASSRSQQTRRFSTGEMSAKKKRKGKAPVEKETDEIDLSDRSEGMITPSTTALPSRAESVVGLSISNSIDDKNCESDKSSPEGSGDGSETGSSKTPESEEDYVPESYADMAGEAIRQALRK